MKKIRQIKSYPVIPRSAEDPANQKGNLKRAQVELKKRFERINKAMKQLVKDQEQYQRVASANKMAFWWPLDSNGERINEVVVNKAYYSYDISTERYDSINSFIEHLLYNELLESLTGQRPNNWFYQSYLSSAYNDAIRDTIQSSKNMAEPSVVGDEIAMMIRQLDADAFNPQQVNALSLVYSRVFNEMKGLTDSMKVDLSETLTRGMASGLGIREITQDVAKRVGVGFSRAQRISRTEILGAYRTAQRDKTRQINEDIYSDSPFVQKQLWFSALAMTSRPHHVAKHGQIYSMQEVEEFYSENGNSINCLCSQSPILVNRKTGEAVMKDLIKKMRQQKDAWRAGVGR
jgi:SPP1 gp7 family putative phage head morphogenesis protein